MPDDANLPAEYPPDEPLGVDEEALKVRGQQTDEPLEERLLREEPEVPLGVGLDQYEVGPLVAPGGDEGLDLTAEAVASEIGGGPEPGDPDVGDIAAGDPTIGDVASERVAPRSAEEEAMHLTEDPPMGDGDGYL